MELPFRQPAEEGGNLAERSLFQIRLAQRDAVPTSRDLDLSTRLRSLARDDSKENSYLCTKKQFMKIQGKFCGKFGR